MASDTAESPIRLWRGVPYLSITGLAALVVSAVVWGQMQARLDRVERDATEAATRQDVQRVEARLIAIEQMLMRAQAVHPTAAPFAVPGAPP